jgi:hypothetical protein
MSLIAISETSLSASLFDEELALEIASSNHYFFTVRGDVQTMSAQAAGKCSGDFVADRVQVAAKRNLGTSMRVNSRRGF